MRSPAFRLVAILCVLTVAVGASISAWHFHHPSTARHLSATARRVAAVAPRVTKASTDVPGPLNGLATPRRMALRRPIAVVYDNFYPDARPQSGLSQASVVFEALAEGGISRLMAIFLEHDAPRVGPIRSARPYFVEWASGYRALFVHAGGAPAALQLLFRTPQTANVEALLSQPQFVRSFAQLAPHNLYTTTNGVRVLARLNSWNEPGHFPWVQHKRDAPLRFRGREPVIHISFSTSQIGSPPAYDVTYTYVRRRNLYLRSIGGLAAVDANTRRRLAAKNVIVLFARIAPIPNDPDLRVDISAIGHGRALIFRDGWETAGTWRKRSILDAVHFWDNRGRTVALDAGPTWIEVVTPGAVRLGGRS